MKSIIDKESGLLLYCRLDEPTEVNEIAINKTCTLETTEPIYWNFETEIFYTK